MRGKADRWIPFTTGESAWLLLGLTGMGYLVGIHALWVVLGEVIGITLAWVWVALPYKEYTVFSQKHQRGQPKNMKKYGARWGNPFWDSSDGNSRLRGPHLED